MQPEETKECITWTINNESYYQQYNPEIALF